MPAGLALCAEGARWWGGWCDGWCDAERLPARRKLFLQLTAMRVRRLCSRGWQGKRVPGSTNARPKAWRAWPTRRPSTTRWRGNFLVDPQRMLRILMEDW